MTIYFIKQRVLVYSFNSHLNFKLFNFLFKILESNTYIIKTHDSKCETMSEYCNNQYIYIAKLIDVSCNVQKFIKCSKHLLLSQSFPCCSVSRPLSALSRPWPKSRYLSSFSKISVRTFLFRFKLFSSHLCFDFLLPFRTASSSLVRVK